MQLPKRRSQMLRKQDDIGSVLLTSDAILRLKRDLDDLLKNQRPQAVADVSRYVQLGDLSENAEYQEAKSRMARIDGRIFSLQERLKRASVIDTRPNESGLIQLGSTVDLDVAGKRKTYQIVGPHETNPTRGRISHLSPLGLALIGHKAGQSVTVQAQEHEVVYNILEVR